MAGPPSELDAHEQPSDEMRAEWKFFSKLDPSALPSHDSSIDDPRKPLSENGFQAAGQIDKSRVERAFSELDPELAGLAGRDVSVVYHALLPGLLIVPNLVPPEVQKSLLCRMLHRDLSNPIHQTNMHLHYTLPYHEAETRSTGSSPESTSSSSPPPPPPPTTTTTTSRPSFFALAPDSSPPCFLPKDPTIHKPLTARQVLTRRLHWVTLGGQYDWTSRVYPDQEPPRFPADLSRFLETLFPETRAEAAIVNFYSPGDTMMMHRDVSEESDKGLISLSFGCDCLFMIAPNNSHRHTEPEQHTHNSHASESPKIENDKSQPQNDPKKYLLLRLRSGDAIYMTKEARYAWHGVPKVIKGTCPPYLRDWPSENGEYADWEGWMGNKRINLNVRQMRD